MSYYQRRQQQNQQQQDTRREDPDTSAEAATALRDARARGLPEEWSVKIDPTRVKRRKLWIAPNGIIVDTIPKAFLLSKQLGLLDDHNNNNNNAKRKRGSLSTAASAAVAVAEMSTTSEEEDEQQVVDWKKEIVRKEMTTTAMVPTRAKIDKECTIHWDPLHSPKIGWRIRLSLGSGNDWHEGRVVQYNAATHQHCIVFFNDASKTTTKRQQIEEEPPPQKKRRGRPPKKKPPPPPPKSPPPPPAPRPPLWIRLHCHYGVQIATRLVWARVKGYPWWPALVLECDVEDNLQGVPSGHTSKSTTTTTTPFIPSLWKNQHIQKQQRPMIRVEFFGTREISFLRDSPESLCLFDERYDREKRVAAQRSKQQKKELLRAIDLANAEQSEIIKCLQQAVLENAKLCLPHLKPHVDTRVQVYIAEWNYPQGKTCQGIVRQYSPWQQKWLVSFDSRTKTTDNNKKTTAAWIPLNAKEYKVRFLKKSRKQESDLFKLVPFVIGFPNDHQQGLVKEEEQNSMQEFCKYLKEYCRGCVHPFTKEDIKNKVTCHVCHGSYHFGCCDPPLDAALWHHDDIWTCSKCTLCQGCFRQDVAVGCQPTPIPNVAKMPTKLLPLCSSCVISFGEGRYCPNCAHTWDDEHYYKVQEELSQKKKSKYNHKFQQPEFNKDDEEETSTEDEEDDDEENDEEKSDNSDEEDDDADGNNDKNHKEDKDSKQEKSSVKSANDEDKKEAASKKKPAKKQGKKKKKKSKSPQVDEKFQKMQNQLQRRPPCNINPTWYYPETNVWGYVEVHMLNCDVCKLWVHAGCAGVTQDEYENNERHIMYRREFLCQPCCKQRCLDIWEALQKQDISGVFAMPVTEKVAPNYHDVISQPMDLQTIRERIDATTAGHQQEYLNYAWIRECFELMVRNALVYNNCTSNIWNEAKRYYEACLEQIFENDGIGKAAPATWYHDEITECFRKGEKTKQLQASRSQQDASAEKKDLVAGTLIDICLTLPPLREAPPDPPFAMPFRIVTMNPVDAYYTSWLDACICCGSSGAADTMLFCVDCGEAYHAFCVHAPIHSMDQAAVAGWRCPNCKICEISGCVPVDELQMLVCEMCDRGFSLDLLDPPLETVPKGLWICGQCVQCKTCKNSNNKIRLTAWSCQPECCYSCGGCEMLLKEIITDETKKLSMQCGICFGWCRRYDDNVATCRSCGTRVHAQCDTRAEKYLKQQKDNYDCLVCFKIDPEEVKVGMNIRQEARDQVWNAVSRGHLIKAGPVVAPPSSSSNKKSSSESAVPHHVSHLELFDKIQHEMDWHIRNMWRDEYLLVIREGLRFYDLVKEKMNRPRLLIAQVREYNLPIWMGQRSARFIVWIHRQLKKQKITMSRRKQQQRKLSVGAGSASAGTTVAPTPTTAVPATATTTAPTPATRLSTTTAFYDRILNGCHTIQQCVYGAKLAASFVKVACRVMGIKTKSHVRGYDRIMSLLKAPTADGQLCSLPVDPVRLERNQRALLLSSTAVPEDEWVALIAPGLVNTDTKTTDDNNNNAKTTFSEQQEAPKETYVLAEPLRGWNDLLGIEEDRKKQQQEEGEKDKQSQEGEKEKQSQEAEKEKQSQEGEMEKVQSDGEREKQQQEGENKQASNDTQDSKGSSNGKHIWKDPRECCLCHLCGDDDAGFFDSDDEDDDEYGNNIDGGNNEEPPPRIARMGRLLPMDPSSSSTTCGTWVHTWCALWSSEVWEDATKHGQVHGVEKARSRGAQLKCFGCGRPGATVGCHKSNCSANFHFPCAKACGAVFTTSTQMFCAAHAACAKEIRNKPSFEYMKSLVIASEKATTKTGGASSSTGAASAAVGNNNASGSGASSATANNSSATASMSASSTKGGKKAAVPPPRFTGGGNITIDDDQKVCARIGALVIHCLGTIVQDCDGYHSRDYITPPGYMATRIFWSFTKPRTRTVYFLKIARAVKGKALFVVVPGDNPAATITGTNVDLVYHSLMDRVRQAHIPYFSQGDDNMQDMYSKRPRVRKTNRKLYGLNGPQFFGFGLDPVRRWLEVRPGVEAVVAPLDPDTSPQYQFCFAMPKVEAVMDLQRKRAALAAERALKNASGCARAEGRRAVRVAGGSGRITRALVRSAEEDAAAAAAASSTSAATLRENKLKAVIRSQNQIKYQTMKSIPIHQRLIVRRSHIHGWGLFTKGDVPKDGMIVEYMGEVVRRCIADQREKEYEISGEGSCYMFRLDLNRIVDATLIGSMARFMNHSCQPNAYAKVITVDTIDSSGGGGGGGSGGQDKKIVVFASRDIVSGEEITYDYKFPVEDGSLRCTCGAPNCIGRLN